MTVRRAGAAVAAAVAAVVAVAAFRALLGRRVPHRPASSRIGPQRVPHGWCEVCGVEVRGDALHEVVDAGVDADGALTGSDAAGGGTAMAAEYCADHCPGTCRRPHPPTGSPAPPAPVPWRRPA